MCNQLGFLFYSVVDLWQGLQMLDHVEPGLAQQAGVLRPTGLGLVPWGSSHNRSAAVDSVVIADRSGDGLPFCRAQCEAFYEIAL